MPELIQHHTTPEALAAEAMNLLRDEERYRTVTEGLREVREKFGPPGAVDRAAAVVLSCLRR